MATPVWLVTGAGTGFGQFICMEALSRGHNVIATARAASKLSSLVDAGAKALELDVCAPEAVIEAKVREAHATYGNITYLVNAAGYVLEGSIEEANEKEVFDQFNTNVFGTIKVCRAALPYLREQKHGCIANFGSLCSWIGSPATGYYNSTKWAVSGFTESLAVEAEPLGIYVTCIEPGMFRTAFLNAGKRIGTARRLDGVYQGSDDQRRVMEEKDNKQMGDVSKAAQVVVDVLTRSGEYADKKIPVRLVLGSDAADVIRDKCKSTLQLLKEWEATTVSTDYKE